jgi:hypothetical protein
MSHHYKSAQKKNKRSLSTKKGELTSSKDRRLPMLGERLLLCGSLIHGSQVRGPSPRRHEEWYFFILITILLIVLSHTNAFAGTKIPGADASDKLEAAGTLLRIVDSVLFSWGARIFAGLCVMSAGWNLKEQRFGIAVLCIVAALGSRHGAYVGKEHFRHRWWRRSVFTKSIL